MAAFIVSALEGALAWRFSPRRNVCRPVLRHSPATTFHSSTSLCINRFLFRIDEVDQEGEGAHTVTLAEDDYRAVHAAKILDLHNRDTLRAGIVGNDGFLTDTASIEWISHGAVTTAEFLNDGKPPGALKIYLNDLQATPATAIPPVSLILALPRPLQLGRMLPMISQMGVDHLVLTAACKVPKDYFGSHLFRQPHSLTQRIIEGLEQAGDVRLPKVTITRDLSRFLTSDLDRYFPADEYARAIAHPTRGHEDCGTVRRLRDCRFPNAPNDGQRKIVVAVGPEGGWSEPDELDMFKNRGFEQVTMGSRVLRSDCAVVSLLSLAHDVSTAQRKEEAE
jgi:16S rRNA (uracil1498-N3)-methyltransferase